MVYNFLLESSKADMRPIFEVPIFDTPVRCLYDTGAVMPVVTSKTILENVFIKRQ